MSGNRIYKTIAIAALLAEFIIFFVLLGKIRNITLNYNISENTNLIYFLLIFGIAITVLLFILLILATNNKESDDIYKKQIDLTDETKHHINLGTEDDKEELLDVEHYLKKILPKSTAKMDLIKYSEKLLSNIAKEFDIVQGLIFVKDKESDIYNIAGKYAYFGDEEPKSFNYGETLSGQVAKNKTVLNLEEIPDNYVTILSGLGSSSPDHLIIIPIVYEDKTIAIIELASFKEFKKNFIDLFEAMSEQISKALLQF